MKGKGLALLLAACMLLTGCAGKTGQTAPSADDTPQRTETAVPPQTEREKEKNWDDGFSTAVSGRVEDPEGAVTDEQ